METNDKKILETMVTGSYQFGDEEFLKALKRVANNGKDPEFSQIIEQSAQDMGSFMKYIANVGRNGWIEAELPDGTEFLLAKNGDCKAFAIPRKEFSSLSKQTLAYSNIDLSKVRTQNEVTIIFSTPKIDYGCTWVFFGQLGDIGVELGKMAAAGAIVNGLTRLFTYISEKTGLQQVIGTAKTWGQVIESGINEGLDGNVEVKILPLAKAGFRKLFGMLAQVGCFFAVYYLISLIIDKVLFQTYQSFLLVYNVTDKDLLFTIPYSYNCAPRSQPSPEEKSELEVPIHKVLPPGSVIDFEGLPIRIKEHVISMTTAQYINDSKFLSGLGWMIKLTNPDKEGFHSMTAMQSIPRVGSTSISVLFDQERTDYEQFFNEESGKHTDSQYSVDHHNFKGTVTSAEEAAEDGYNYKCSVIITDTSKYNVE